MIMYNLASAVIFIGFIELIQNVAGTTPIPHMSSTRTISGGNSGIGNSVVGWNVLNFPNPQRKYADCGRTSHSWVCDPSGVISQAQADQIDILINDMKENTGDCKCPKEKDCPRLSSIFYGGYQPAVALVNKMNMRQSNPTSKQKRKAASEFAEYLRDEDWEFGECNDDLVIFVSRDDRQVYTAVGEITRLKLTDRCVNEIFKNNSHFYKDGNFGEGIRSTLISYLEVFRGIHPCTKSGSVSTIGGIVGGIIAVIVCAICCVCCCRRAKGGSGGGGDTAAAYTPAYHHDEVRRASKASSVSLESGGGGGEF